MLVFGKEKVLFRVTQAVLFTVPFLLLEPNFLLKKHNFF